MQERYVTVIDLIEHHSKLIVFFNESMFKVPNRLTWNCYLGVEKGSKDPKGEKVGKVTIDQLRTIAAEKLPDLNCSTIESAMRIIAGTAANMGIVVDPPVLEPKQKELV